MIRQSIRRLSTAFVVCGLSLAAAGCGASAKTYAPSDSSARESLEKALSAWGEGGKADRLGSSAPSLHVVDFQWQAGQALEGYEVLAAEPGEGAAEKRYAVNLRVKGRPETRVQYVVIGRDPVWVFRDQDYQRTSDMGDNPRPAVKRRRR
jgi:hypothetical protein